MDENELQKIMIEKEMSRIDVSESQSNFGMVQAVHSANFLFCQIFDFNKKFLIPSFIYALCSVIEGGLNSNFI